jgi:hypothetical protein
VPSTGKNIQTRHVLNEVEIMRNKNYPNLFTPIEIGNMVVQNRIAMVPTDISSANADGSVNQRVITYHEEIAKGGCGFIIVGATTPDKATGRPTVTCLAADADPLIPGLAPPRGQMCRSDTTSRPTGCLATEELNVSQ